MDQIIPRNYELDEYTDLEQVQSQAQTQNIVGHIIDGFVVNWLLIKAH